VNIAVLHSLFQLMVTSANETTTTPQEQEIFHHILNRLNILQETIHLNELEGLLYPPIKHLPAASA